MIHGAHVVVYSKDAEADRAYFRDVLKFPFVDAHAGWLIFALPPSEVAFHPDDANGRHVLYLTCDDLAATMEVLQNRDVVFSSVIHEPWGILTHFKLPGGGEIGLYQPKHPMAPHS